MSYVENRLRELRESLGYSTEHFAKMFGIHRSSLMRYEGSNSKELRELPLWLAVKICNCFNINNTETNILIK